jgi:hypothetical protein
MLTTTLNATILRNYLIAAASVIFFSIGAVDLFNNPYKNVQQEKINSYGRYISAGLVSQAQKLALR